VCLWLRGLKVKLPTIVPLKEVSAEPYASVVCYPRSTPAQMHNRLKQLRRLSVQAVEFSGKSAAFAFPVFGKGYVGIVVVAHIKGERFALKMRRSDADRESLEHEAELLQKANSVGVGPKFAAVTKDFLLMQLIDGDVFPIWVQDQFDPEFLRVVLRDILEQCWRLDEIYLDHGELSKAPKHLLVDTSGKPFIVDFETASLSRNASNVTSVCQFLFQGNSDAGKKIAGVLGQRNRDLLVGALKSYKKERNRKNFEVILKLCLK
jgi:putative serine/threonine protein kinase